MFWRQLIQSIGFLLIVTELTKRRRIQAAPKKKENTKNK